MIKIVDNNNLIIIAILIMSQDKSLEYRIAEIIVESMKSPEYPVYSKNKTWYEYNSQNYGDHFIPTKLITKETQEAKILIKLLSTENATTHENWYIIGQCLHNINIDLMQEWLNFSKLCPIKYNEVELIDMWNKMRLTNSTIATLRYYAYRNDPVGYKKLRDTT